jgi:threonine dehydrogenase-like Zn-dependent dehydrogenase
MKAYYAEADWAPKPEYILSEREKNESRAMRADFVYKNVRASLKDVNIPQICEDEVLIKVGACGVCGSDLHALASDQEGYSAFASHMKFPVILGHEFSGEVVEVGGKVKNVRVGDLISVEQIRWCGTCNVCRTGMFNQCNNLEETGLSCDGAFSEYAAIPEKYCCVINGIAERLGSKIASFEAGALAEPTCVAYSGIQINAGGIKPGANVAVFGVGPIGLASIALAQAFGASKIFAFNTNPARSELATQMGADYVSNPDELLKNGSSAGQFVLDETGGIGAGLIVEATGNFSKVYPEIIRCLGNGAKVVQLGIGATPAIFDVGPLLRKNAQIIGSLGQAGSDIFPSVLRLMESGRIDMRKMITGRYPLEKTGEAIRDSGKRELGHGKVMVSQHYDKVTGKGVTA